MARLTVGKDEVVKVDMTTPVGALLFPFLEVILITGVCWMAIGWLDRPDIYSYEDVFPARSIAVALWAGLVTWRFVIPLLRQRRKRFIVTNQRIIARPATFRSRVDSIPLRDVIDVQRRRKGISLAIRGFSYPIYFGDIKKSKKVVAEIRSALNPSPYF